MPNSNPLGNSGVTVLNDTALATSTVVMSVAGQYATGDYIGTSTTPQAFSGIVSITAATGTIKSVRITDKVATTGVAMELWLFSATFVAPTDNAAWTVTDAEALTCVGVIALPAANWYASGANKVFTLTNLSLAVTPGATSLYYALVARDTTPTWASGDLTIGLGVGR